MRKSRRLFPAHMSAAAISGERRALSNPDDPRYDTFALKARNKAAQRVFEHPHPDPYPMAFLAQRGDIPRVDVLVRKYQGEVRGQGTEKWPGYLVRDLGKIKIKQYSCGNKCFFERVEILKETTEITIKGVKRSIIYLSRTQATCALNGGFIHWETFETIQERPAAGS